MFNQPTVRSEPRPALAPRQYWANDRITSHRRAVLRATALVAACCCLTLGVACNNTRSGGDAYRGEDSPPIQRTLPANQQPRIVGHFADRQRQFDELQVRVEQARRDAAEHQAELELQREHNKIWLEGFKNHYQDSAGK